VTLEPLREKHGDRYKAGPDDDPVLIKQLNRFSYRLHYERHNDFFIKSLIIELYSTFESIFAEAHSYIVAVNKEQGVIPKAKTQKNKTKKITEYKDALTGLGFEFNLLEWDLLEQLGNCRNILAHADGRVDKQFRTNAANLIASTPLVTMKYDRLEIDPQYVDVVISVVESVLLGFHAQTSQKSKAAFAELEAV
jgi:hypothetical protein